MSDEIPVLDPLGPHVSCRDCVFADYEGDTQVGCKLGRIDKLESQGATIVGLDDDDRRYLIVSGRFCNARRLPCELEGVPPAQYEAHVRERIRPRVAFLVYAGPGSSLVDLITTVQSMADQTLPAYKLVIALDGPDFGRPDLMVELRSLDLPFPWGGVLVDEWDDTQREAYQDDRRGYAMDLAFREIEKATYYAATTAGLAWPTDLIDRLDRAINETMIPLAAIWSPVGLVIQAMIHRHELVVGNRGVPIGDKLPWVTREFGKKWRVLPYGELP